MYKFLSSSKSKLIPLLSYSTLYKSSAYSFNWVSTSRIHKPKIESWNGNGSWILGGKSSVRSYSSESDRESINYDVVIVGAGPAGLSAAIKLKQLCQQKDVDISVCVVEKGAEVGAHILSGNVFEPRALDELVPHWKEEEAPVDVPVTSDNFWLLTENRAFSLPSPFDNNGNYVISLSQLVRWMGQKAEELGVEIYPGFAASEILCNEHNEVTGIATNDMGVAKDGSRKENYQRGVALKEGCRGSLSEKLIKKYNLREKGQGQHQTYALGIKEVWEIDEDKHQPGYVLHTLGWPLDQKSYGGSFLYHMKDRQVAVGLVVALNYQNPFLNPYEEYQRFKRHPAIRPLLEGGTVLQYGARSLNEGGFQSIPYPVFPGGAIIGCSAGFLNVPKIKGTHTAMKSGMLAAESAFSMLQEGTKMENYWDNLRSSWIWEELYTARNYRPAFEYGLYPGLALSAVEHYILKGRSPVTLNHGKPDHEATRNQQDMASYLGQVESLKDRFYSLMPSTDKLDDQETQRDRFFMVLALIGLRADLTSVRDQILSSPSIPTLEEVFARLLRITSAPQEVNPYDASIMAVQTNNFQGGYRKGKWKNNKHCTHCNKGGHVREECRLLLLHCTHCNKGRRVKEECRLLHGKPPRNNDRPRHTANVAHNGNGILPTPDVRDGSSQSITLTGADYNEYLQYQASRQQSSTSSAACTGQPVPESTLSPLSGPKFGSSSSTCV